jgi:EAL domain-containing protein (putative c-di-GMP-specific phosphodiesterase class I)
MNSAKHLLRRKGVSVIMVDDLEPQEAFDFNYVELLDAINQDQLELWFQPKVKLSSSEVVGYEALLRWHHPRHGLIAPGAFLQSFNDYRLDQRLNEWVINSAFSRSAELSQSGISKTVAINLEANLLEDELTIKTIKAALDKLSVDPSLIEFEIIETMVISKNSVKHKALLELKQMGFSIAIDDFGTGTNNISYLMYLPVDTVKLDRMFCINVNSIKGFAITSSAIAMAKSCGYTVVAEGIETEAQADMMYSLGCELGQGFYFGKPEPQTL